MKKRALMIVILALIALLTLSISFVLAQNNNSSETPTIDPIDKAYQCLENKVTDKCADLTLEQQIFSLLALNYDSGIKTECKDAILDNANNDESGKPICWPKDRCSIKNTAQAVLALSRIKVNTDEAEAWLLSQNTTPTNLDWYLQIESEEETACTLSYGPEYSITIGTDKKITGDAGSCLPIDTAGGSYWLRISSASDCYDRTYTILCDKSFITTLLYKKSGSSTVHVSEKINSASSGGETTEKISSICFGQNGVCDYEGSLWASVVLDTLKHDVSAYLPYLTSNSEDNRRLLPDAFLYILKSTYPEFYSSLISQQTQDIWQVSGDQFYDTALALLALRVSETPEVTAAKDKLITLQDAEGCWQGNIRNTAFLLYVGWPKSSGSGEPGVDTPCSDAPGFCRLRSSCTDDGGEVLDNFECPGLPICCSTDEVLNTCQEEGGIICNSNQICSGNPTTRVSDIDVGQKCCLGGECRAPLPDDRTDCDRFSTGGVCKSDCGDDESVDSSNSCNDVTLKCCVPKAESECSSNSDCAEGEICSDAGECVEKGGGLNWKLIWILIILIIIVIIGIIFRDKLRVYWMRLRHRGKGPQPHPGIGPPGRFGPGSASPRLGGIPSRGFSPQMRRPMTRHILPMTPISKPLTPSTPSKQSAPKPAERKHSASEKKPAPKKEKEYEDVMEKLKRMSK